jgi:hypothetical protein
MEEIYDNACFGGYNGVLTVGGSSAGVGNNFCSRATLGFQNSAEGRTHGLTGCCPSLILYVAIPDQVAA